MAKTIYCAVPVPSRGQAGETTVSASPGGSVGTAEVAAPLPPLPDRLRVALWGLIPLLESCELALAAAKVEATGPVGDPKTLELLTRVHDAAFLLSNYLIRRTDPFRVGGALHE